MQKINYDAIIKNAMFFKNVLGNSKLCAVLKNDAYGHGIVRTASALSGIADCFAVGNLDEATKISQYGDVLILLPIAAHDVAEAVSRNFILTVDSFDTLNTILANLPRGKRAHVHIKINSGMNRLGFTREQLLQLLDALKHAPDLKVEGAFSHFFGSDKKNCDRQLSEFEKCRNVIASGVQGNLTFHIANTAGVLLDTKYHLDMARVGLGLYGYGAESLIPAKTVTAQVIATRAVSAGEMVGYDAAYTFPRDTRIAVVNCGYAYGFPRALTNAKVKINGHVCNVVGNVCMAMLTVDVGNLPVAVGDEVILLGEGVNNANCNVIVYELLCNLRK